MLQGSRVVHQTPETCRHRARQNRVSSDPLSPPPTLGHLTCVSNLSADVVVGGLDLLVVGHIQLQNLQPSGRFSSQLLGSGSIGVQNSSEHQQAQFAQPPRQRVSEPRITTWEQSKKNQNLVQSAAGEGWNQNLVQSAGEEGWNQNLVQSAGSGSGRKCK